MLSNSQYMVDSLLVYLQRMAYVNPDLLPDYG